MHPSEGRLERITKEHILHLKRRNKKEVCLSQVVYRNQGCPTSAGDVQHCNISFGCRVSGIQRFGCQSFQLISVLLLYRVYLLSRFVKHQLYYHTESIALLFLLVCFILIKNCLRFGKCFPFFWNRSISPRWRAFINNPIAIRSTHHTARRKRKVPTHTREPYESAARL